MKITKIQRKAILKLGVAFWIRKLPVSLRTGTKVDCNRTLGGTLGILDKWTEIKEEQKEWIQREESQEEEE